MVTYQEWKEEGEKQGRLQGLVDRIGREITQGKIREEDELNQRIHEARQLCQKLFPERMDLFELIYQSRLARLFEQFVKSAKSEGRGKEGGEGEGD